MPVFHFKLYSVENEDFLMEIEVKENQTFEDFHNGIVQCLEQPVNSFASFYLCDDKWNKNTEFALKATQGGKKNFGTFKRYLMKKCKLKDYLKPDSKLIYEADFLQATVLRIEIIDIYPAKQKIDYPVCVHKEGSPDFTDIDASIIMDDKEADRLKSNLLQDFESILDDDLDDLDDF